MNLTVAEVRELPVGAALFSGDEILAQTAGWRGAGPGTVTYPVRSSRLLVNTGAAHPACAALVSRLLDEVDAMAAAVPRVQAMRVRMLADSLRVVAGRSVTTAGRSADVVEHACAGIASRTALRVEVGTVADFAVSAPPVAALVLVQLAVNAEAHEQAAAVTLDAADGCFAVTWHAAAPRGAPATARRRADRPRWGLGFARIAADSLGARLFAPTGGEDGVRRAILETGLQHLALPLALVEGRVVRKATRGWDEETGLLPGMEPAPGSRAAACVAAAAASDGEVVRVEGWSARRTARRGTWIAIPPDAVTDRARDVLDGMVHERALWDGTPEPGRSRAVALAALVGWLLGDELPRVSGATWNARAPQVAAAYGLAMPMPRFEGVGVVDPRVALFLAQEIGERFEVDGDDLCLRIAAGHREHPLPAALLPGGGDVVELSRPAAVRPAAQA